ncbi:MAG: shikimate kinase [Aigarchaeota archaeon]|nr:shikimate kinase [Candidatus Wolframiiraptor gerlachensis]
MRGARAVVHGAVSILNAIPTWIGGALGVDLWTEAEAWISDDPGRIEAEIPGGEDPSLVIETARTVLQRARRVDLGLRLRTRSNIPMGRGLKSSSAASDAVALAVARLVGLECDGDEVVRLAVEASIRAGVTITGAYDDAYTCYYGGINITDNKSRKVLLRRMAPEDVVVVISVPEKKIYTRSVDVGRLSAFREVCLKAARLALQEKFWDAMILNGLAIASALDLDPSPILDALRAGAIAAGVSGTGPAIAAITSPKRVDDVREALRDYGDLLICGVNNFEASWEVFG